MQEHRFRFGSRIAIALAALLFTSCASLTPDQAKFWADLAGQAAQVGLQIWLQQNPEHRENVKEIVDAMGRRSIQPPGLESSGPTEEQFLAALPVRALGGPGSRADLFITETSLLIHDKTTGKSKMVDGKDRAKVLKAIREGMRRAVTPLPPMPVRRVAAPPRAMTGVEALRSNPDGIVVLSPQDDWREFFSRHPNARWVITNGSPYTTLEVRDGTSTNSLPPVVESHTPTVANPATVPNKFAPRLGVYRVEKREGTNWSEVSSFSSGLGEFRVKRVR